MIPWCENLRSQPAIAVVRATKPETAYRMARAAIAGGFQRVEIAGVPGGEHVIAALQGGATVGAGTVLSVAQAEAVLGAGAQFVFAPHWDGEVGACCRAAGVPYIPGALTPTEIWRAWQGGATAVKVFPIQTVGATYLSCIRSVYPQIPLIPTGGVTRDNAGALLGQGAIAVGVASDLFPKHLVQAQNWEAIAAQCHRFLASLPDVTSPPVAPVAEIHGTWPIPEGIL
ncbi:MAG: bifunctional 4-hydroxy-2-oxoglutarate aldolase/2-dehydro-3-deoxy-phosphogluconate aldolase [Pseudanabaenaceae cyanobacterium]